LLDDLIFHGHNARRELLVCGLNLRQSNSASVATWLHKRYAISGPFSSFVVVLQRTMPYSYERSPQAIDSARLRLGLLSSFVVALSRAMSYS